MEEESGSAAIDPSRARRSHILHIFDLIAVSAVLFFNFATYAETSIPWKKGEELSGGWIIADTERHPEFVRLILDRHGERTGVEISAKRGTPGKWSSDLYAVQAAPGFEANELLLGAVSAELAKIEKNPSHRPFVSALPRYVEGFDYGLLIWISAGAIFGLSVLLIVILYIRRPEKRPQINRAVKYSCFRIIILAPALLFFGVVFEAAYRVYRINGDSDEIRGYASEKMETPERYEGEPFSFEIVDGRKGFRTRYKTHEEFIPFEISDDEYNIYVYGGSSVVEPYYHRAFPFLLEEMANRSSGKRFKVFNFGVSGYTSYSIKNRLLASIAERKPDLIIIYSGHNDYVRGNFWNKADELHFIRDTFFTRRLAWLLLSIHQLSFASVDSSRIIADMEKTVFSFLCDMGIIDLSDISFDAHGRAVLEGFGKNLELMMEAARKGGIPVVLITPVSNLEREPDRMGSGAMKYFRLGMNSDDYDERISNLIKAKDLDLHHLNTRSKSRLNDYLRSIESPGVHVLDLENELIRRKFDFGDESFLDYVHFRQQTHRLVGEIVFKFMVENDVCCGLGEGGMRNDK